MDLDLAEEITYRLIGVSVTFSDYEETIYINPYIKVTLSTSTYMDINRDSYFKIGFNPFNPLGFLPTISFSIFSLNPRAKELGIKLKDIIDDGEICVESSLSYIAIKVCVFKSNYYYGRCRGSIKIIINLPPRNERKRSKKNYDKDSDNVEKAFGLGACAIAGFLLFKIVKGGIGAILGGPVGAAVGFAC